MAEAKREEVFGGGREGKYVQKERALSLGS